MKPAILVVVLAVLLCAHFAFAQAGLEAIRPLMDITQADVDAVDPDRIIPLGELPDYEYRYWYGLHILARFQVFPVWSPDGDAVYITATNSIWRVPVSTGQPEMVADFYMQYEGKYFQSMLGYIFNFGPDSNELLYASTEIDEDYGTIVDFTWDEDGVINGAHIGNHRRVLYAVDVETGQKRLVDYDVLNRVYSETGRYYAYLMWGSVTGPLYIVDTLTDNIIELPCSFATCAFTPNERYLIAAYDDDESGLVQINLETGENTILFEDGTYETRPHSMNGITNNGEWVIYSKLHSIEAYNLYTGETRPLLSLTEDINISSAGNLSPDNRTIAFAVSSPNSTEIDDTKVYLLDIDLPLSNYDDPLAVSEKSPASFALQGNYPNPFNPTTTIGFTLAEPGAVCLTIYSATGQAVRQLINGQMAPGRHSLVWDGRDDAGNPVAAGMYVSCLVAGVQTATGRMMLIK